MNYLLDTCALIWLGMGGGELSESAKHRLATATRLHYSPISAWELARLQIEGKIILPTTIEIFLHDLTKAYGLSPLLPTDALMISAAQLPYHHRDPADRMIIATAIAHNLTVVTGDEKFAQYGVRVLR